ncbi:ParA family protein [Ectothiorhodospiraceae bacterium BW-2]|nr:ParA family protein [Ectothiorhodospiraceae bacterium BW-2]
MKVLTIANNKGGVGKTTLSRVLGEGLSFLHGKRVLLIDSDPQANLTSCYLDMRYQAGTGESGIFPPPHPDYDPDDQEWSRDYLTLADLYVDNGTNWYPTETAGISIIASDPEGINEETVAKYYNKMGYKNFIGLLGLWLREIVAPTNKFDVVIIDTPPSRGPLTKSAFSASTHVLSPMTVDNFATAGVGSLNSLIDLENQSREENPIKFIGILLTQYQKSLRQHQQIRDTIYDAKALKDVMLTEIMHSWGGYKTSTVKGWEYSVFARQPKDRVRVEATNIVKIVKEGLFDG